MKDIELFTSDETDEWSTPPKFVRPLSEAIGGFDLDPASGAEESPIAENTYTEKEDGLSSEWYGNIWCNPPYSEMKKWVRKSIKEKNRGNADAILFLCKGDTSTNWWHTAVRESYAVAMVDHRLSFGDNVAPFASHVIVFGEVNGDVISVLTKQGIVFKTSDMVRDTIQEKLQ